MRERLASAVARALLVHRAPVAVVLLREVLAPLCRIARRIGERHDTIERVPCLLLTLKDIHEERSGRDRDYGVGYGKSSGYGSGKDYTGGWRPSMMQIR